MLSKARALFGKKAAGALIMALAFAGMGLFAYLLANNKISLLYNKGYEPDQPIPFSHKLHAGQYKIDCLFCHAGVETAKKASLPSLNICMSCHQSVKTDSPWIQKLAQAFYAGEPVAWAKVHLLPDFVRFSHFHHIEAGKKCSACHGPVEEMERVYQYKDLSMGFCVNCHRQPREDQKLLKDLKAKDHHQAPVDCKTCHQ